MIETRSDSANLGDNLMITPLLNHVSCKLNIYDGEWNRFTAEIFNGLCEVNWIKDFSEAESPKFADIPRIWSKRLLVGHGFPDVSAIPKIKLTDAELLDGRTFVDNLKVAFGKPIVFVKSHPGRTTERVVPAEIIDRIVANNPQFKFVTFNLDNHPKKELKSPPIKGVYELFDFPIRAQASCYAAGGLYVGADTGDYHLMLSVGGKADVLCPAHSISYNWWTMQYGPDCWLNEKVRVNYHDFNRPLGEGLTGVKL